MFERCFNTPISVTGGRGVSHYSGSKKKWYGIWILSSIIVLCFCYIFRPNVRYTDEFAVLLNSINVISYTMAFGIPFFLAASISFSSSVSKSQAQTKYEQGASSIRVFLSGLGKSYLLASFFVVCSTIALFIEPSVTGTTFYTPQGTGFLIYLPSVIIASLFISFILTSIGVFLAVLTDEVILSTAIGSTLTIFLALIIGWVPYVLRNSLTRSIAMVSPHNLLRTLAVSLTNYDISTSGGITSLVGFQSTFGTVISNLAFFAGIALIFILLSVRVLHHNVSYWKIESGQSKDDEIWAANVEGSTSGNVKPIARELKMRRVGLIIGIGFLILTMSMGTAAYQTTVREESTIVFYQSPDGGEPIHLGEWYIFSCNVQSVSYDVYHYLHHECHLIDWGSAPSEVTYFYSMLNMSTLEFNNENETARRNHCNSNNRTQGDWGGMGGSWNLLYGTGTFIFVLKIVAANNEALSGSILFSIKLSQSAGWP